MDAGCQASLALGTDLVFVDIQCTPFTPVLHVYACSSIVSPSPNGTGARALVAIHVFMSPTAFINLFAD